MITDRELERVAASYEGEGYDVAIRPGDDRLPDFAAGMPVDLLATKGRDGVLVAVKETRREVAAEPALLRLAEAANSRKGWRFDLVVLRGESEEERAARDGREPSAEEIAAWLDEAEAAASAGASRLAYVGAWAAFEAAMRRAAAAAGIERRWSSPATLLSALYSAGCLDRDEFDRLEEAAKPRGELIHGFVPRAFDAASVARLVESARRMLAESRSEAMAV